MTTPPDAIRPMLATAGTLPTDEAAWTFEFKWDGIRAVGRWDGTRLALRTRTLRDVTVAYPELAALGASLGSTPTVLDGEIVALDANGVPSFQRLQERMHVADAGTAARKAATTPVAYFAFDVLWIGAHSTMAQSWAERRGLLEGLDVAGPSWATPPTFPGAGTDTFAAARSRGLEGVVAKRLNSTYEAGARSSAWRKVKVMARDDFVVGGWLPGEGNREGRIGALLVGTPAAGGLLHLRGGVGTGFTARELARLSARFAPLRRTTSPFIEAVPRRAQFVEPEVVVDVEYRERTDAGILRHPSYKGERVDKAPADVQTDD